MKNVSDNFGCRPTQKDSNGALWNGKRRVFYTDYSANHGIGVYGGDDPKDHFQMQTSARTPQEGERIAVEQAINHAKQRGLGSIEIRTDCPRAVEFVERNYSRIEVVAVKVDGHNLRDIGNANADSLAKHGKLAQPQKRF